ncbi:MAG: 50S ribosomal protein L15 [Deltaproteobacteria bacterium]
MSATLSQLAPPDGARSKERRVGRGPGCRKGKVSGRGMKGQKARQPGNLGKLNFQGGQTPMQRRLPKRGFRNPFAEKVIALNVSDLQRFEAKANVDERALREARLVQGSCARIKILGDGDLTKALTVTAHSFTPSARLKIEAAGGTVVELIPPAVAQADSTSAA